MREVIRLGVRLLLVTLVAGTLLGATHAVTQDPIERQTALRSENARRTVLSAADRFEPVPHEKLEQALAALENGDWVAEVYQGFAHDQPAGYAVTVTPAGYVGPIELVVGIDQSLTITGVTVVSHTETPGLGSNMTRDGFISQYNGQPGGALTVVKSEPVQEGEIMAITGATVTTRAVTKGVNLAAELSMLLIGGAGQ